MNRVVLLVLLTLSLSGCAKFWNRVESNGGFFGSYVGDYVIINHSGGRIMDVWKLKNVMVQSSSQSDGWLFKDGQGNMINLGGDVKIIRVINGTSWDNYYSYHSEFEKLSYESKFFK